MSHHSHGVWRRSQNGTTRLHQPACTCTVRLLSDDSCRGNDERLTAANYCVTSSRNSRHRIWRDAATRPSLQRCARPGSRWQPSTVVDGVVRPVPPSLPLSLSLSLWRRLLCTATFACRRVDNLSECCRHRIAICHWMFFCKRINIHVAEIQQCAQTVYTCIAPTDAIVAKVAMRHHRRPLFICQIIVILT